MWYCVVSAAGLIALFFYVLIKNEVKGVFLSNTVLCNISLILSNFYLIIILKIVGICWKCNFWDYDKIVLACQLNKMCTDKSIQNHSSFEYRLPWNISSENIRYVLEMFFLRVLLVGGVQLYNCHFLSVSPSVQSVFSE